MKIALNAVLILLSALLIYLLIETIRKPIDFKETREFREENVRERLKQTAALQKLHKSLRKVYASSYDSLKYVLMNDSFEMEMVTGDKFDTNQVVTSAQIKIPALDSLKSIIAMKGPRKDMTIDEYFNFISTVPFSGGQKFYLKTGQAIVEGTDSLFAPTFEAGTTIGTYMSEYDSASHVIYDPDYNPGFIRKVGDLNKPSTTGNW
jgi:hypothetical protein